MEATLSHPITKADLRLEANGALNALEKIICSNAALQSEAGKHLISLRKFIRAANRSHEDDKSLPARFSPEYWRNLLGAESELKEYRPADTYTHHKYAVHFKQFVLAFRHLGPLAPLKVYHKPTGILLTNTVLHNDNLTAGIIHSLSNMRGWNFKTPAKMPKKIKRYGKIIFEKSLKINRPLTLKEAKKHFKSERSLP